MHYYQFNIGDYASHTGHLDPIEDIAYRRMLDWCYIHETPLPLDVESISRLIRMRDHKAAIRDVLNEFFEKMDDGWFSSRVQREIDHYRTKVEQASKAGKASAERRLNKRSTDVQPTNNQEPITINQKPKKESQRGTRLAPDFALPDEWVSFCRQQRPELDPRDVFDGFRDYWVAQPGQKGVKTDWTATWRNWVRRQQATQKTASEARQTAMAALTRGLAVPKPAAKPFWEKTENQVEVGHVERKRLL